MLPSRYSRISASLGAGFSFRSAAALITMPGVQKPHCRPWFVWKAAWMTPERAVGVGHALDGADLGAFEVEGEDVARLHRDAVDVDDAGAALGGVAADVGAGEAQALAEELDEEGPAFHLAGHRATVHGHGDFWHGFLPVVGPALPAMHRIRDGPSLAPLWSGSPSDANSLFAPVDALPRVGNGPSRSA